MTTIAFDTSTPLTVAAVNVNGEIFDSSLEAPAGSHPAHCAQLVGALDSLLTAAGSRWDEVERIGVGAGPGTFTGIRIASSTAEGLRRPTGASVVPVSSLEALALPLCGAGPGRPIVSVIDAKRGEVFAAGWSRSGDLLFGPVAWGPHALVERLQTLDRGWALAGELPGSFEEAIAASGVVTERGPTAIPPRALCELAISGDPVPGPALPTYVREPDAVRPNG